MKPKDSQSNSKQSSSGKIIKKSKKVNNKAKQAENEKIHRTPIKKIIKPKNQVELSEEELASEVSRILTADDPNRPKNISTFSYKEGCFKFEPPGLIDQMTIHFRKESASLHIHSKEYKQQKQSEDRMKDDSITVHYISSSNDENMNCKDMKNKNQFNFSDRATQTINNKLRNRFVCTEPPPLAQFNANVSQWEIYDSYITELRIAKMEHAESGISQGIIGNKPVLIDDRNENDRLHDKELHNSEMAKALKIMERLVNQNSQDEIYDDYKYWEDASDEFRPGEGSILPLWRFSHDQAKKKQVTSICWNPKHKDFFAVGYGSYNFMQQINGVICCYSLKNTSYPEYTFHTDSGVLSLDFHPIHSSLLAVGFYNGNVAVFDVAKRSPKPIFSSSITSGQHRDPAWQVRWQHEEIGANLNFNSISSDGTVLNWSLSKNELKMELMIQLKFVPSSLPDSDEVPVTGLASGCCFDYNPKCNHLFLVGTEEGNIFKCSTSSAQHLEHYQGHHMAVYAVKWNPFDDDVFISCSADWTVKIWDQNVTTPLLSLDLGNSVGDVSWSPYSSTIFTAATSDGKVHVYNLAENKLDPSCRQKIVKNSKLTKVSFGSTSIILVGDDRGITSSLKLSPNLRKSHTGQDGEDAAGKQKAAIRAAFG